MYLSGKYTSNSEIGSLRTFNGWSRRDIPGVWAADNGCFNQPDKYTNEGYLSWLSKLDPENCLFATAPDVVGDAAATRARAYPILAKIRELGFRAAYVVQDGETPDQVRWDELDAIFIGGSTEWKLGQEAADLAAEAKKRGKWVHMGRVNSLKRMKYAKSIGCDSVDGTYLAFAPEKNEKRLQSWIREIEQQPTLDI